MPPPSPLLPSILPPRPHLLPIPQHQFNAPLSSLLAPFNQTGPNRGPLFGSVWSNKGHSVWPDRSDRTKALCSVHFSRTEALHSTKTRPNGARDQKGLVPGSGEETRAKGGAGKGHVPRSEGEGVGKGKGDGEEGRLEKGC